MSDETKVKTPTGFMEVRIELDPAISEDKLAFLRSAVYITSAIWGSSAIPVSINNREIIPLKPGLYRAKAVLAHLVSEEVNVDISAGQTRKITFFFGRES